VRASRASQLAGWYVALLVPTLYVKHRFMLVLSRWWVEGASTSALSDGEIASPASLWFGHVAPPDLLEVGGIVLALWLIGHGWLRVRVAWLATLSVAVAVLFLGLTLVSLGETGSLLTREALVTAWRWVLQDARAAAVTNRQLLLAAGAVLWVATPVAFASILGRLERAVPRLRLGIPVLLVVLVAGAAVVRPDAILLPFTVSLSRGLWSSAVIALMREADDRPTATARSVRELQDSYIDIVYPAGRPPAAPIVEIPESSRRLHHVLLVILETAPRELYRLVDNDALPTFRAMSRHALVSERHYSAAPRTDLALYAIMSGTYPRAGAPIYEFGRFRTDGLATVLAARGYRSTYVDSITLKWNVREEALAINDLGFPRIVEEGDAPLPPFSDPFDAAVARERTSISLAHDAILDAERQGQKALVAVATNLGHFPWRASAASASDPPAAKVAGLAAAFDRLMAEELARLADAGLSNEVIVVIVGDHGLRFAPEFESFGVPIRHGDLMFDVPLLIYAPAIFSEAVRVPWATSHVDIEPTLLDLLGVPRDGLVLHGENMLDRRLADRVTLLPSGMYPPMYPVDGLSYRGQRFTWATALDRVRSHSAAPAAPPSAESAALEPHQVRDVLRRSRRLFDETATHFLAAAQPH
jgi:hypothetical protein